MPIDISYTRKLNLNLTTFFFIICCFPWVSFSTNTFDSQPWPLLSGSIILLIDKQKRIPKYILVPIILTILGFIISLYQTNLDKSIYSNLTPFFIRTLFNFSSFYIVLILSWNAFSRGYEKLKLINTIKFTNFIYYIFAFVQYQFPSIVGFLTNSRGNWGNGRGLNSLTPEPTYFAFFLILSSLIIFAARGFSFKEDKLIHLLNIFTIIFIAQSASGIFILLILFFGNIVRRFLKLKISKKDLIIGILLTTGLLIIVPAFLQNRSIGSRFFILLLQTLENPNMIYLADESTRVRIGNIVLTIYIAFKNYLIPQGILGLTSAFNEHSYSFGGIFKESFNARLMTWIGDWIYTLGIFGLSSLSIFFIKIKSRLNSGVQNYFLAIFSFILLFSIPISFPFAAILISLLLTNPREEYLLD